MSAVRSKFVLRLLDARDALLGWAEVHAEAQPQREGASCPFWPLEPTRVPIDVSGMVTRIAVHWCDLDVARVREVTPGPVVAGTVMLFTWLEPVWLVPGMRDVPLPAVTVGQSILAAARPGVLGAAAGAATP